MTKKHKRVLVCILLALCTTIAVRTYLDSGLYNRTLTLHQLLTENNQLKKAVSNLSSEDQIGYAKVISQQIKDGVLLTTIKFVETARDDKTKTVLEKQYSIEGDIIHFDALIVKFPPEMVLDGSSRALYLWRRIYGEKMTPEQGFPIENPGAEPGRYADLLENLPIEDRKLFWANIWQLANDTEKLKQYGIEALYGNAIYSRLREGLIYVFKISPTGQVYPEIVPVM